jgi:hypothetical protein
MSNPPDEEAVNIPQALERSEVPLHFRQFQNAAVLKKLAHSGKGPLYQLIGKKAWYETADIVDWLNSRKRRGPPRADATAAHKEQAASGALPIPPRRRRGRPSKAAVWKRMQEQQNQS